jgi:very-short-patch-repair endonuclease
MADVDDPDAEYRHRDRPRDSVIARLGDRQQGVAAHWQLLEAGFSPSAIARRVEAGRLHPRHRGVYSVGHRRLTRKGRWMAAVLACGPEAVLSHRSAAALWELPAGGGSGPIHVTVPGRRKKGQEGIRVHNVRHLHRGDVTTIDNIPVTSLARTLLDEAEIETAQRLRTLVEATERLDLFDFSQIEDVIARSPGRHGIKPLKAVAAQLKGPPPDTRSRLERGFLEYVREAGLPEPSVNVVVLGDPVDFYWAREKVIIETDSYKFHKGRQKFEDDRLRDTRRQLAGLAVVRVTDTRIDEEPEAVVRDVSRLLALRRVG